MQLTRFDRWLREKFTYETHVQVLRLPDEKIPGGIKVVELPDTPGRRFKYLLIAQDSRDADKLFTILRDNSMMYNTQIVTRDAWYVKYLAPEEKSVTWWTVSWLIIIIACLAAAAAIIRLLQNPEIRENLREAFEILKG